VHGLRIAEGAHAFRSMVMHRGDPPAREKHASAVVGAEPAADHVTAAVQRMRHRSFISPMNREQIHGPINAKDDVLDLLHDSCELMSLYDPQGLSPEVEQLAAISVRCEDVANLIEGIVLENS
jgi:hypothetical protein